ncbi:helix-turn-helix domain-containing protein [Rhodococcus daqingensis]|uniref:Helix-turn-helix domain-containing protein n=1 Tax=Rhodococcus daqingensis TaxID=2479363 RepID=A0ABW2S1G0_9NOCA
MPGHRLTRADRQQISAGLAKGLDLAAIARHLGRPTSTVSREVARNGGPGRYRADLAQLATHRRARRRPHSPVAQSISQPSGLDPDRRAAFVTDFAAALVQTGMPRTAAGVMASLFTSETGSHTAAELARLLQVSAATISHAVRLLEDQGLVRHERDGRRHRYFLDEDAGVRSAMVSVRANQHLAATALHGAALFGADTVAGNRLALAGRFLERLGNDIVRTTEQCWRDVLGTG